MTQSDLGARCGCDRRTILSVENDATRHTSIQTVAAIARALNTSIDYLVYGDRKA